MEASWCGVQVVHLPGEVVQGDTGGVLRDRQARCRAGGPGGQAVHGCR